VAVVLAVTVSASLSALLYFEVSGLSTHPGLTPIGTAFSAGSPVPGNCSSSMVLAMACARAGDFDYTLSVYQSTLTLASVEFEVCTPTGTVFANLGQGEFSLVTISGVVVAYTPVPVLAGLAMATTWTNYGGAYSPSSVLSAASFTIVIDFGQTAPTTGLNLTFVAVGVGSYSGTTVPLLLP
jgi:hypothetical protein